MTGWLAFWLLWLWAVFCLAGFASVAPGAKPGSKIAAFWILLIAWPVLLWYFMKKAKPKVKEGNRHA
jgi:hypothetical protein